jgi:hypothetical protein
MAHDESYYCKWALFSPDLAIASLRRGFFTQKHNGKSDLRISALLSMGFCVFRLL